MVTTGGTNLKDDIMRLYDPGEALLTIFKATSILILKAKRPEQ